MTSPLEARLLAKIAVSQDPTERAVQCAELACYYARVGNFNEAELLRSELRAEYGNGKDLRVSVLIMTAEALLLYFRELSPAAGDRVARAQLLCTAAGEQRLLALTSSWAAHIDFNEGRFDAMVKSIDSCLRALAADDGTADCRISLVLMNAFLYAGRADLARPWYERAHRNATKIGDQAAIAAMIYNRSALKVSAARIARISEKTPSADFAMAAAELRSAINYEGMTGLLSLDHLLGCAQVSVLIYENRYEEALNQINDLFSANKVAAGTGLFALLSADQARCLAELGRTDEARTVLRKQEEFLTGDLTPDDLALCHASLETCASLLGDESRIEAHRTAKKKALAEHQIVVNQLLMKILKYSEVAG